VDDKRNLITAVLLSALILIGWSFVQDRFFPTPKPPVTKTVTAAPGATATVAPASTAPVAVPGAPTSAPAASSERRFPSVAAALAASPRLKIANAKVAGSINLVGARIDDLTLVQYRETIDKKSPPVRLFSPGGTAAAHFAEIGWTGNGVTVPGKATLWTASGASLTPKTPVALTWANGTGQTFRIELSIDDKYLITAKQTVANDAAAPVSVGSYALVNKLGVPTDPAEHDSWTIHIGPMGVFNGAAKDDYRINYTDLVEGDAGQTKFDSTGGWIGFTAKYWLSAVIADPKDKIAAEYRVDANKLFQTNFTRAAAVIEPGKSQIVTSRIFSGAKESDVLTDYQNRLAIPQLDRAIDWGWFYWFEKPIFALLDWLFGMVSNFGVAIMLLTLIIRGLMFPIAQKQFHSMAQMRVVQPKMQAIQEKYKDDKPRLQQELMGLYKQEKINPLAGCLPIFLQIPIFYALYKVLMLTIEMRHQPFVLWINDLSAPDPAKILNLFGYLNFDPPALLGIGVLAVLLGLTMFLQFKLNPAPADPVQAQVFAIMPWMLMFVMAPFAAGLLLYWITNNILTIAQQKWMYSRYPALKQAAATPAKK
jgi:YidC/Oxa1 family membrane protein insertase